MSLNSKPFVPPSPAKSVCLDYLSQTFPSPRLYVSPFLLFLNQRTSTGESPFSKYPSFPASKPEPEVKPKKHEADKRIIVGPLRVGKAPQAAQWTKSVTLMNQKPPKSMLSKSASTTMVVPPFC
jgi:hypothetical protein